jgi:hypothetical protein
LSNFNKIPEFYKEVMSSWIKTGGDPSKDLTNILRVRKQIVWGNKFIQLEKIYLKYIYKKLQKLSKIKSN